MRFGIIGYGSIGKRHADNLQSLGFGDTVLLRKQGNGNDTGLQEVANLQDLLALGVDQIILSNPTASHMHYLRRLLPEDVNILAEKPLVANTEEMKELSELLDTQKGSSMVAFNMRFHPCVTETEKIIRNGDLGRIYAARFFVGQYLPDWRPGRDYTQTYSAKREMGGGVGLDLIHEIDLAIHLLGYPEKNFQALADHVSDLQIETEDLVEILYQTSVGTVVSIHLDYLTRGYRRDIYIMGEQGTLSVNLANATLVLRDYQGEISMEYTSPGFQRNSMYLDMLDTYISMIRNGRKPVPSFEDGLRANEIALRAREGFYHVR